MSCTVTGNILDAEGLPLHATATFTPVVPPFPYIAASGQIYSLAPVVIRPNPTDGSFSVVLNAGTYTVSFGTSPATTFTIVVPSSGTYSIDQLAGLPPPSPTYTPSGTGSPEGVVPAPPGSSYVDVTNGTLYFKLSGTGTTGWQVFIQL